MRPSFDERDVICYHCGVPTSVAAAARTASCTHCYKGIVLDDLRVRDAGWSGRLSTCGKVTIDKRARAVTRQVVAGQGVEVTGTLEANIESHGPVVVGESAHLKGDCSAPTLVVREGAVIESGYYRIGRGAGR
jgi:hypothetical protein